MIYELVLIDFCYALLVNRSSRYSLESPSAEGQTLFIDILLACRLVYREALPILYGKNMITFNDRAPKTPLLPFPRAHISLLKWVTVTMEPYLRGSTSKMALLLENLAGAGVHLSGLFITIGILRSAQLTDSEIEDDYPPSSPDLLLLGSPDLFLLGKHPIVEALSRLPYSVETLEITMLDEARFAPWFAHRLVDQGKGAGHTVTISKGCSYYHHEFFESGRCRCFVCETGAVDLFDREYVFPYEDDEVTDAAVDAWKAIEAIEASWVFD